MKDAAFDHHFVGFIVSIDYVFCHYVIMGLCVLSLLGLSLYEM